MDAAVGTVLGAAIGAIAGGSGGALAIWSQGRLAKIQQTHEQEKEERRLRLLYVHPFRSATIEFEERADKLERERWYVEPSRKTELLGWMGRIKEDSAFRHSSQFLLDCNGVYTFAMNTLHITARFLAHAVRARNETPFRDINRSFSDELTQALFAVRAALNDNGYGVYEQLQDNIGYRMFERDSIKTYEQFCRSIADDADFPWYLRLLDYYLDIDHRRQQNLPMVKAALHQLNGILHR
jgi:hypothetical protein